MLGKLFLPFVDVTFVLKVNNAKQEEVEERSLKDVEICIIGKTP